MSPSTAVHSPDAIPASLPGRHRSAWTESDFAGIMAACRQGCDQEEIAARIGRTVQGLRGQLRRMLPVGERHLPADLVLPRLRQLDAEGDYDWLAAMAQREKPAWELQAEARAAAQAEHDGRGLGALNDDELLWLAMAILPRASELSDAVEGPIRREVVRRDLGAALLQRACDAAGDAVRALLWRSTEAWGPWL